jgi:tubulin beta
LNFIQNQDLEITLRAPGIRVCLVCDEHIVGGSGDYCGANDAQLDRIYVFYQDASGGKYVPRAALMNLETCVIDVVTLCRRPANFLSRKPS